MIKYLHFIHDTKTPTKTCNADSFSYKEKLNVTVIGFIYGGDNLF